MLTIDVVETTLIHSLIINIQTLIISCILLRNVVCRKGLIQARRK